MYLKIFYSRVHKLSIESYKLIISFHHFGSFFLDRFIYGYDFRCNFSFFPKPTDLPISKNFSSLSPVATIVDRVSPRRFGSPGYSNYGYFLGGKRTGKNY